MSTTIRVSEETRSRFAELAKATGRPMTELLDEAADALERRVFFDRFAARYADLRHDPTAWDEIEAERGEESSALSDHSA
jgi:predicted transcriptional regulator